MNEKETSIIEVVNETGLGNPQAALIVSKFMPLFEDAKKLIKESNGINITDVSQTDEMHRARSLRLSLKDIRITADKTRKELKEDVVKYGNAVQGVFNLIRDEIVLVEERLEEQEKFIERIQEAEAAALKEKRINSLSKYVEDVFMYNFDIMSDEMFTNLLSMVKSDFDKKKEELKKQEDERLAKEKFEKEENERIRIEHEKLVKEKKEREEKEKKEQEFLDKETKRIREENQKKLEDELEKRLKLEKEIAEKEAKEKKERDELAEKERQAGLAPEKDKLLAYAEHIRTIKSPENLSKAGLEIVKKVEQKLLEISQEIKIEIKNL